ncbi:unnamed protein product, partial [Phaeothamnion confervicola]
MLACAFLMVASFLTVGFGATVGVQLAGVGMTSLQSGLGEASFLALSALYDSRAALTCWSSGTGFAGVFGFAWVFGFHYSAGWSLRATLLAAQVLPLLWLLCYFCLLGEPRVPAATAAAAKAAKAAAAVLAAAGADGGWPSGGSGSFGSAAVAGVEANGVNGHGHSSSIGNGNGNGDASYGNGHGDSGSCDGGATSTSEKAHDQGVAAAVAVTAMTAGERARYVLSLWPYMGPLVLVYAAEYTMQTGAWSAIGFPVSSEDARNEFFELANWSYQ